MTDHSANLPLPKADNAQRWLHNWELVVLRVPNLKTLKEDPQYCEMLKEHPQLLRQMEVHERIGRVELPPIDPAQLPQHLKPLEECIDGRTVYQFGMYRLRKIGDTASGGPTATWEEPLARGQLGVQGRPGGPSLATGLSFDLILDEALHILEDEEQPPYVRHTALILCEAIDDLYCHGGSQTNDLRLWLAAVVGGYFERLKVEQVQHFINAGRRVREGQLKGARTRKKPSVWDRRCESFIGKQQINNDSDFEICRKIAETELPKKAREKYDDWQRRIKRRRRTIYDDILTEIKKRPVLAIQLRPREKVKTTPRRKKK